MVEFDDGDAGWNGLEVMSLASCYLEDLSFVIVGGLLVCMGELASLVP